MTVAQTAPEDLQLPRTDAADGPRGGRARRRRDRGRLGDGGALQHAHLSPRGRDRMPAGAVHFGLRLPFNLWAGWVDDSPG